MGGPDAVFGLNDASANPKVLLGTNGNSYLNGGKVGIGTTAPQEKLHVEGNFYLNSGSMLLNQNGSTNAKFYFSHQGAYLWDLGMENTDGTRSFLLYNRGNSTYPISVSNTNVPTFKTDRIRIEGMAAGGGINLWDIKVRDLVDNDFGIYNATQSVYRLYINNLGNVGLGTTTPQKRLHVEGDMFVNGESILGTTGGTWTSFNSVNGGRIRSSGEGYLWLESNPNGAGDKSMYLNTTNGNFFFNTNSTTKAILTVAGNFGIGTMNPDAKLAVKGTIHAEEVKVDLNVPVPDYVFEPDYDLTPLTEVEAYVKENKHLPEVPSAKQMEEEGLNLKEMNLMLLKKVEELTLHLIEQQKQIYSLSKENKEIKTRIGTVENKIN
jgi:hypothetical protein